MAPSRPVRSPMFRPPEEKNDKALGAAYNLLRGITVNADVPRSPKSRLITELNLRSVRPPVKILLTAGICIPGNTCALTAGSRLNRSSYGGGKPSCRFREAVATDPICSGPREGRGREIGPRCRGLKSPVNVVLP